MSWKVHERVRLNGEVYSSVSDSYGREPPAPPGPCESEQGGMPRFIEPDRPEAGRFQDFGCHTFERSTEPESGHHHAPRPEKDMLAIGIRNLNFMELISGESAPFKDVFEPVRHIHRPLVLLKAHDIAT